MQNEHGIYQVGLKALLRKEEKVLLLRDATTGRFDLPGGRIASTEFGIPLEEILAREIREELGEAMVYVLGSPLFQYRRHNMEHDMPVFITVYDATLVSGGIVLSDEHSSYEWVDPRGVVFKESDFGNASEHVAMQKAFDIFSAGK